MSRAPLSDGAVILRLERYSHFHGLLHVAGYIISPARAVEQVSLVTADGRVFPLAGLGRPSPDLTLVYGRGAAACRFDEMIPVGPSLPPLLGAFFSVRFNSGETFEQPAVAIDAGDTVNALISRFFAGLGRRASGKLLEIGSRTRISASWKELLPAGWRYTGLDAENGENVDIVGDAHRMSELLPANTFDAAMSFSVFEHLLMPWKVAVELNRVLKTGAPALIVAPQGWPEHEAPCDYFRFSPHCWKALFNQATGFKIIEVGRGAAAYMVPHMMNADVSFGEHYPTYLMSAVLGEKTAEASVDWPVSPEDISDDAYPY